MAVTIATIDPVTRLEGHLKIEVTIDTVNQVQQVVEARATGTLFRGFESILVNRAPGDAPHITQRICGVCPVSHGMAAVTALDKAANTTVPNNARIMRNLVLGSNFVQSHILHFFHLAAGDFINAPGIPPLTPGWSVDKRIGGTTLDKIIADYLTALDMRRKAHEMGSIFGGRMPHPPTFIPGGCTAQPTATKIAKFKSYLAELISFIQNTYIPDVQAVGAVYSDYAGIGRGHGNLLAYGVFDLDSTGNTKLLARGRSLNGSTTVQTVDVAQIAEHVKYSWYADSTNNLNPSAGVTTPTYPKTDAYSWLKSPRYGGAPYETGALARMWANGDYRAGISVIDRHVARALEALKVAQAMQTWVDQLAPGQPVYQAPVAPVTATAYGLTEAPRGAIGHWLSIASSKISQYQVITPTCWNASPRDTAGVRGPIEQALIGTPVQDTSQPIEVLRVIHSFDPCLSCAVHVMRPSEGAIIFAIGHYHGEEVIYTHDHGDGHTHSHDGHEHTHQHEA